MTSMSEAFARAQNEAFHRQLAEARSQPQPTRYERFRDRFLGEVRLMVAQRISEYAGEVEIELAVEDVLMALGEEGFLRGLKASMLNPNESSLAHRVAWHGKTPPTG
jgi:hypothetical protein